MSGICRTFCRFLLVLLSVTSIVVAAKSETEVPVRVAVVSEQAIVNVVRLTGTVTSARDASLSPATSGLVTALHVDAGSRVAEGDILLELDPELADWQWRSSQAAVEAARLALADAERRLKEARTLAPQRSIAETVVRDLAAEVAEDEAALQQVQAEAGYRRALLDRHELRAPFTGIVRSKLTELGEWVVPGAPVLELVATGDLRIDFRVAEDYLSEVASNTAISYRLGNDESGAHTGEVVTVVPLSDPGARTFLLRVGASEPNPRMQPGMSARGEMALDTGRRGLVVPRDAIIKHRDGRVIVWVVERAEDGPTVAERRVETGLSFDGLVEIRTGLASGVHVVVQGNESLKIGQRVRVLEEPTG